MRCVSGTRAISLPNAINHLVCVWADVSKSKGLEGKESSFTRPSEDIRSSNKRSREGMPPGFDQSISLDEDPPRSRPEPPPIAFDGGTEEAKITKGKSVQVRNRGDRQPDVVSFINLTFYREPWLSFATS